MKVIIGLLVAVGLAIAVVIYALFGGGNTTSDEATSSGSENAAVAGQEEQTAVPEVFAGETTLAELQALGPKLECRISYVEPETATPIVGTYFVNGEQVRGDFEMSAPELGSFVSSVILSDGMFYSWSTIAGQTFGVKASIDDTTFDGETPLQQPVPTDAAVSYECERWESVDGSIFLPPGDVLFQDMEAMLEGGMEIGTVYEEGEF